MKFLCRTLCVLFIATCALRAAEDEDARFAEFAPVDDDLVLYIPKFALKLGFRGIGGVKATFGGTGSISSNTDVDLGPSTGVANRVYHDGYVVADTRTVVDPAGNVVPITPDGRTNNWGFANDRQAVDDGLMAMHAYSVTTTDAAFRKQDPPSGYGVELSLDREMGSLFGTRLKWGVVGGFSVNQISTSASAALAGKVTTTTDYYSLLGQAAPSAPFQGGTATVDSAFLLGNELLLRDVSTSTLPGVILTSWKLRGAYMTFRGGATLLLPISGRFSAQLSAGAVLVYAGSTYDVVQVFAPTTGNEISQFGRNDDSALLPGYYVDASLQFTVTDTAGLYLGAVYQSSGDYTQDVSTLDGKSTYTTRVDLSSLQGIRAGVSFKF